MYRRPTEVPQTTGVYHGIDRSIVPTVPESAVVVMSLAIDTTPLATHCLPQVQSDLDKLVSSTERRFQVLRLSAHATVIHDAVSVAHLQKEIGAQALQVAKQEVLDWQADQDEDLDELEVLHHLRDQSTTSPLFEKVLNVPRTGTTTLVASCAGTSAPLSSFHRYSLRSSFLAFYSHGQDPDFLGADSGNPHVIPQYAVQYAEWVASAPYLRIIGLEDKVCVVWHLQCDIVDLLKHKAQPGSRPGKRRRTTVNPVLQMPPAENRFNGVRYRPNRRTWVAEMKPPKSRNKVSFGDFKSAEDAARVVDAAFFHYNKPGLLNFPDSARILSPRPPPEAPLTDQDKLKFVMNEAKWLASIASTLPGPVVDPSRWLDNRSVQITEGWNTADDSSPVISNSVNLSQPYETQTTWTHLVTSPAIPTIPVPPSPSNFQDEIARLLIERQ